MNNQRRKEIGKLIEDVENAQSVFEDIRSEEEEYFENMPENLQDGERGQASQEAIDNLQCVDFQEIIDTLQMIIEA